VKSEESPVTLEIAAIAMRIIRTNVHSLTEPATVFEAPTLKASDERTLVRIVPKTAIIMRVRAISTPRTSVGVPRPTAAVVVVLVVAWRIVWVRARRLPSGPGLKRKNVFNDRGLVSPLASQEKRGVTKETKFSNSPKMVVAFVEARGDYSLIGAQMRRLKDWIDLKGIEQSGYPFCLFYDNPRETKTDDLRSEACIPVASPFTPEGDFKFKEIQAVLVAETRHSGAPEEFYKTYGPFLEGLLNDGYKLLGPAREYFMTVSEVRGLGSGFLIQQPVGKK
jgi:DNA gyrase inhibitor GyrI